MEANQINEAPVEAAETATGKSRMSKGQMIGMVVLTIVALAGVAFGVWGMMEKDKAEKNLAIKITETSGMVTEMITDKITSVDEDGTVTEITDTNVTTEAVNPEDYIYIGEWGIKIKIPENLDLNGYAFFTDKDSSSLRVEHAVNAYGDEYYIAGVGRTLKIEDDAPYEPAFSYDGYYYVVSHSNEYSSDPERSKIESIVETLSNPENYSKI